MVVGIINNMFNSTSFIPSPEMSDMERLSSLLALVVIISFVLYAFMPQKQYWIYFLGSSVISIVIIRVLYPYTEFKFNAPTSSESREMEKLLDEDGEQAGDEVPASREPSVTRLCSV